MAVDRIAVVGISASGKSTFARLLAARTGLPLLYGDHLDWLPNWRVRPAAELDALHKSWIERPRWIIEGWIEADRVERLNLADIVIDLDYSRWLCTWRVFRRMVRGARRVEMPEGCCDQFSWKVLGWVFWKQERPAIEGAIAVAVMKNYVRLRTAREALEWLNRL